MAVNLEEGTYRIAMDGAWNLEDLYQFPRTYEQAYFMLYSLLPHDSDVLSDKIADAYSQFPWQGGYSAVNFYNKLKYTTPRNKRPQIVSIKYSSPGWIDVALILSVASSLGILVKSLASAIKDMNIVYNDIQSGLSKRKLLRIDVRSKQIDLEKKELEHESYIENSLIRMSDLLDLDMKDIDQLNERTGSPLKTLKILLSLYRRLRKLASFQNSNKIKF